jgi:hypothetical protein
MSKVSKLPVIRFMFSSHSAVIAFSMLMIEIHTYLHPSYTLELIMTAHPMKTMIDSDSTANS